MSNLAYADGVLFVSTAKWIYQGSYHAVPTGKTIHVPAEYTLSEWWTQIPAYDYEETKQVWKWIKLPKLPK